MKSTVQIGLIMLVFGIGLVYQNHILLSCLTALAIGVNIYFFLSERRELRDAKYYIRPGKPQTNFWAMTGRFLMFTIAGFGVYYLLISIPEEVKIIMEKAAGLYIPLIVLSTIPANYHQHFKSSIRSFDSGLTIPKNDNSIIIWKAIKSVEIVENILIVKFSEKADFIFEFDIRDADDAVNIKNQFEQNAYNIN